MDPHDSHTAAYSAENAPSGLIFSPVADLDTAQPLLRHDTTSRQLTATKLSQNNQTLNKTTNTSHRMLEHFEVFGEDDFAVAFLFWLTVIFVTAVGALLYLSFSWITAIAAVLAGYVLVSTGYCTHSSL